MMGLITIIISGSIIYYIVMCKVLDVCICASMHVHISAGSVSYIQALTQAIEICLLSQSLELFFVDYKEKSFPTPG